MSVESTVASPSRVKRPGRRMDTPMDGSPAAPLPQPGAIKPLSLRRNFSWTLAGNVIYAACQWGIIVALTKLGTPTIVGRFTLALSICSPIIIAANLNLRYVQASDARGEYDFRSYFALRLIMLIVAGAVIGGLACAMVDRGGTGLVILAMGLAKAIESLSDLFHGLFQQHERMDYIARSQVFRGVAAVAVMVSAVYMGVSLSTSILLLAATWGGLIFIYDLPIASKILGGRDFDSSEQNPIHSAAWRRLAPSWNVRTLIRLGILASPLGIATVLHSLAVYTPRYFVAYELGEQALGYYGALAYAAIVLDMLVRALGSSAMARLSRHFISNRQDFLNCLFKVLTVVLGVNGAAILVVMFFGASMLETFYDEDYASHASLFSIIVISAGIAAIATVFSLATTAARLFHAQMFVCVVNTVVTIAACWFLVPRHGLHGAAMALVISAVLRIVMYGGTLVFALRRWERVPIAS